LLNQASKLASQFRHLRFRAAQRPICGAAATDPYVEDSTPNGGYSLVIDMIVGHGAWP
jgi:hypothetical protein